VGEGGACKFFVGKPKGKRLLGRSRRRLKDNVEMDIQEILWRRGAN
jgi:hypothetical protein